MAFVSFVDAVAANADLNVAVRSKAIQCLEIEGTALDLQLLASGNFLRAAA